MSHNEEVLAEHFHNLEQQRHAASIGMWVFLATEVLFIGALLTAYLVTRLAYPEGFATGSQLTHIWLGTTNTALLITSSFTMATAVRAAEHDHQTLLRWALFITAMLGVAFLAVKGYEYHKEWQEGLVPGLNFTYGGEHPRQVELFYWMYFVLTGYHALHLTVGIGIVYTQWAMAVSGRFGSRRFMPVEVAGLYWSFVDIVWLFLYPMFYLIKRFAA